MKDGLQQFGSRSGHHQMALLVGRSRYAAEKKLK